jgi:hypothetical protein
LPTSKTIADLHEQIMDQNVAEIHHNYYQLYPDVEDGEDGYDSPYYSSYSY